jgi:hypothetical protein
MDVRVLGSLHGWMHIRLGLRRTSPLVVACLGWLEAHKPLGQFVAGPMHRVCGRSDLGFRGATK